MATPKTKYNSYPAYKPSGVPWLGDVPAHWEVRRLGTLLQERGETNSDERITEVLSLLREQGVIPYSQKGNIGNKKSDDITRYKIVRPNDIVMNSMNVIIGSVGLSRYTGCLSPVYYVLTNRSNDDLPRYLNSNLQAKPFQRSLVRIGNGILAHRMRIPMELLKCEVLPRPPLSEQAAIVRYLDHADRRIRRYVDAKRKLIALLEEEKQAVINQAVTRGLDPNVPLKPSGVEWLGDVPEHWEVRRLSQVSRIVRGKFTHRPRNDPSLYDGPYPFIQTGDIAGASKMIMRYTQTLNERGFAVSTMFPRGTLVMTIAANIGDVAILGFDACFPDSVVGFGPNKNLHRDHLYYLFTAMKREFLREAPVNTQGNLNVDRIGSRKIPFPPFSEQASIVGHIDKATADIDAAVVRTRRQIDLMEEYRTRLIADVVTGKLDVREAAAQLPDEPDDQDQLQENGPLGDGMDEDLHAPGEFAEELAMPSNMP